MRLRYVGVRALIGCEVAVTFQTIYTFPPGIGPAAADVGLALDQAGLLYGVISGSQALPNGAIFKLDPTTGVLTTLHVFSGGADGAAPQQTLLPGPGGVLYGTTEFGGDSSCRPAGCGIVFKLDPVSFRMTTLHAFADFNTDGAYPDTGALVFGRGGNLYGATSYGGAAGAGTIYTISPAGGALTTILASAEGPVGAMVADASGTLYGATSAGGPAGAGTLFKLAPPPHGQTQWTQTTMYAFTGTIDGGYPLSGLAAGRGGALFGTTACGNGALFSIAPATGAFAVTHRFTGNTGTSPFVPLAVDARFNLYGTAPTGGAPPRKCHAGCGTIYQYSPVGRKLTVLYEFVGGASGTHPQSPLVLNSKGAAYGTAQGGVSDGGTVFMISP